MQRRKFIKNTAIAAAGTLVVSFLPKLKASNTLKYKGVKNVILCLLGGGVRKQEILFKETSSMPYLLKMRGTLFNNIKYSGRNISHAQAEMDILTGHYNQKSTGKSTIFQLANHFNEILISDNEFDYGSVTTDPINSIIEKLKSPNKNFIFIKLDGMDVAHWDFSAYTEKLKWADQQIAHLWNSVLNEKGLKENTLMIIIPDHGRNETVNTLSDHNGCGGLDHYHDTARSVFCKIAGPAEYCPDIVINAKGESIDVASTIAAILDLDQSLVKHLPGNNLLKATLYA